MERIVFLNIFLKRYKDIRIELKEEEIEEFENILKYGDRKN